MRLARFGGQPDPVPVPKDAPRAVALTVTKPGYVAARTPAVAPTVDRQETAERHELAAAVLLRSSFSWHGASG